MQWLIARKLKSKNALERRLAAEELGRTRNAQALAPLGEALKDTDWGVRKTAAEALGRIKDTRAIQPLVSALKDPDTSVAETAVKALGEIGDRSAVEPLLSMLMEVPFNVLYEIRDTLTKLDRNWKTSRPARAAIQSLVEELRDPEDAVRLAAAQALSLMADGRATEALIAALADRDPLVRPWAASGLGLTHDSRAVGPLIKALGEPGVRGEAMRALREIGDSNATPALIEVLEETDQAIDVLGEIGDARAVAPLMQYFLKPRTVPEYRNNPTAPQMEKADASRPIYALQKILERHAKDVSPEDLRALAALENRGYHMRVEYDTPAYGDGADDYYVEIDVSQVRELAQQELQRREAK